MISNINKFEQRIYSQNGEDGIIEAIFNQIKTTNKFFVEFGVGDGKQCNTRYLLEKRDWDGLMLDGLENTPEFVKREFVTPENVNCLFEKYKVPYEFDLLSVDIDGNDYWVWKAIDKKYSPRIIIIEYNASYPVSESRVIYYNPKFRWDGTNYFGASLLALVKLAKEKRYILVGCDNRGVNAFFIRNDLVEGNFKIKDIKELYKPPNYAKNKKRHPKSNREMKII